MRPLTSSQVLQVPARQDPQSMTLATLKSYCLQSHIMSWWSFAPLQHLKVIMKYNTVQLDQLLTNDNGGVAAF
jgi:hypothetical protein